MRAFIEKKRGLAVSYFFVMDQRRPVFPMGLCGPFAKRREAKNAASKLRQVKPFSELTVHQGTFFGSVQVDSLARARLQARADLKAMLSTDSHSGKAPGKE
ncbi:hypothetical protein [Pseudomonas nitroreducens]|uniref:hypothetical protein n=1 Tax=Pseudomonas nitroreducens TaxID=46680 RepID=UPI00351D825F